MPQFQESDIPELSDTELANFLNITVAELLPGEARLQHRLYRNGICIVGDFITLERDGLRALGYTSYRLIGNALQGALRALLANRNRSGRSQ